jgi:hypothetical protein
MTAGRWWGVRLGLLLLPLVLEFLCVWLGWLE